MFASLALNYCMAGRAIQGKIPFKMTIWALRKGGMMIPRSKTEYFSVLPDLRIAIIDLLYDFRITIVAGNKERAIIILLPVRYFPLTDQSN